MRMSRRSRESIWILIILAVILASAAAIPSVTSAADTLSREERARLEDELVSQLAPTVEVFDYVAFQVDGEGNVTLLGKVREASTKSHVAEDAKKVKGIKQVRNRIEVLPLSRTDDQIRKAAYNAVYGQTGFERYRLRAAPPIHIIVKNGSVTLEGVVGNKVEYAQASAAVRNVPGVFAVKNNLRVDSAN
jgi:hyperosmotically inducible periplasmic protein